MKRRIGSSDRMTACHLPTVPVLGVAFLGLSPLASSFCCHRHSRARASIPNKCSGKLYRRVSNRPRQPFSCVKSNRVDRHDSESENHRWKHTPFDFSSKQGWENFYQTGRSLPHRDNTNNARREISSLEYEWHSHIPHSAIIQTISPSIESASSRLGRIPSVLIVGCGNSSLPRILHDAFSHPVRITCLDYSSVCIDMIRDMYGDACPNMDFVVGDAMRLKEVMDLHNHSGDSSGEGDWCYDVVIDKGLMDALMCGEGFDVDNLQRGIDQVLTPNEWGMHVLICFPMIKGMKERLVELGQHHECDGEERMETERNLFWMFDLPVDGSENGRATFNVGKRCLWKYESKVETLQTNWN